MHMLIYLAPLPVGLPFDVKAKAHWSTMLSFMPRVSATLLRAAIAHGGPMSALGLLGSFGWFLFHINLRPPPLW